MGDKKGTLKNIRNCYDSLCEIAENFIEGKADYEKAVKKESFLSLVPASGGRIKNGQLRKSK